MCHGQSIIPVAPAKIQEKKHGHVLVDVEFEGMDYTTIIRWNIKMNIEYMNKWFSIYSYYRYNKFD